MKKERQAKILELISAFNIETQEELQQKLISSGFDVTQATVSRDIKELRVAKLLDGNGVYRYAVNHQGNSRTALKYNQLFSHSIVSVAFSMNDVVIKCHVGMAQGACAALDMMHYNNILGTIAGDDTIFVITRTEADAEKLCRELSAYIG